MSAMRSASSTTTISRPSSSTSLRSTRSMSRPGVAMIASTPSARALICLFMSAPPYTATTRLPIDLGQRREHVVDLRGELAGGHEHEAAGRAGLGLGEALRAAGRPKASVLPEPVLALPQTSRPARASAMVRRWIAKGSWMPWSASALTRSRRRRGLRR